MSNTNETNATTEGATPTPERAAQGSAPAGRRWAMARRPILVDSLVRVMNVDILTPRVCIDGQWMISKPLPLFGLPDIRERIYHAWLVLAGRADAHQYAEDLPQIMARLLAPDGAGEVAP